MNMEFLVQKYFEEKNNICLNVVSLLQLQKLLNTYAWLHYLPGLAKGVLRNLIKLKLILLK